MSDKKQDNDLLNYYPDLSDEDDNQVQLPQEEQRELLPNSQPHKIIKTNQGQPPKPTTFAVPMVFGGRQFLPPPPPPGSRKNYPMPPVTPPQSMQNQHKNFNNNYQASFKPNNSSNSGEQPPAMRQQRQRKNCLYVKNIPKHYNEQDKLMTFFKNEGQIKQIKVNHQESSAVVRFVKEQNALRFINSKKAIFNRSFITYSLNEKETVTPELVKERENQEAGKIKKPVEIEMRQLKQRMEGIYAEKIRAILFCLNNLLQESARQPLEKELNLCIQMKNNIVKYSYEEIVQASKMLSNQYDWTIAYTLTREGQVDKKIYILELQKKYGPITSLQVTPISQPQSQPQPPIQSTQQPLNGLPTSAISQHIVKLWFLCPRLAWQFYYWSKGEQREEKGVQIEGVSLRSLFNEGIIKIPQAVRGTPPLRAEQLDELLEINQLGQVRPPPPASQIEVDHPHQINRPQPMEQEQREKEQPKEKEVEQA